MNKIFTSMLALACSASAFAADGFYFMRDGKQITEDATIEIGYEEVVPGVIVKWDAGLELVSDRYMQVTVNAVSENVMFQFCPPAAGSCLPLPAEWEFQLNANSPEDVGLHTTQPLAGVTESITGTVTAYETENPDNKITLEVVYVIRPAEYVSSFYFMRKGEKISGDATIEVGYEEVVPGTLVKWDAGLELVSDRYVEVTVNVESENAMFQFCPPAAGNCLTLPAEWKFSVNANSPEDVGLHTTQPLAGVEGSIIGTVTAYETENPENKITLEVVYVIRPAGESGIANVTAGGDYVRLESGNTLSFNFSDATRLEVYSILGNRLIDRKVSGNGSVSLGNLGRGVYVYRAGRLTGKIVVK